jgi:hypothetical protein
MRDVKQLRTACGGITYKRGAEAMISDDNLQPIPTYPLLGQFLFWLLWMMGLLVCLLFSLFVLITVTGSGMGGTADRVELAGDGWGDLFAESSETSPVPA